MIIDINNIIGKHKYKPEVKVEDLIEQMDKANVDKAVVFCHAETLDNDYVEEAIKKYPDRLIGLYTVNPWSENAERDLEDALNNRPFKGLRLDPVRHGFAMNETELIDPLFEICSKYNVPIWCYGAAEVFSTPILFEEMAVKYSDTPLIIGYMGFQYDSSSAASLAKRCKNIYLDTTGCMFANMARALSSAGPERTLLGTGTPYVGFFELEIEKIMKSTPNPEYQKLMLGENAARIFNIKK